MPNSVVVLQSFKRCPTDWGAALVLIQHRTMNPQSVHMILGAEGAACVLTEHKDVFIESVVCFWKLEGSISKKWVVIR